MRIIPTVTSSIQNMINVFLNSPPSEKHHPHTKLLCPSGKNNLAVGIF